MSASAGASVTASASANASPSATSTLSAKEQQAFEEATTVVLAYRQTITDLYSGARTNLNDLNDVATGDEVLDQGLLNVQQSLNDGWRVEPSGAEISVVFAKPLAVDLTDDPNSVVVRACVDASSVTEIDPDGERAVGVREELDYTVTRTTYLPEPGWAVSRVSTEFDEPDERRC